MTESSEEGEVFPYAVTLDDFIQEITLSNGDKKVIYHLDFSTKQENLPTTIVLNIKDNNDLGQAIYLTSSEGESAFYPISIKTIPTKKLTIVGDDGSERAVAVNTRVKIEATHDNADSMALIGKEGYLFYNDQGTISFALAFDKHHLIEYVQIEQRKNDTEQTKDNTEEDSYYQSILLAWEKQQEYIDSIDDPKVKQSVQTPHAAAVMEATRLEIIYPEDVEVIKESLQKVLAGE
ncbi:hypothetical protein [Candidatus Enterococcus willemsii]|uniref:Uncharacterized protein n=1 Tax=Candidatus Enterococcus willemsii TaxID=1857215 RepID=A0ABQ6Z113_9ENTE|nr:hypothetical protein [Enterococcus sp. CU12B]KAF1304449.1 hypothetical protein BAU17_07040 [Enterococcus sp. CU12B]